MPGNLRSDAFHLLLYLEPGIISISLNLNNSKGIFLYYLRYKIVAIQSILLVSTFGFRLSTHILHVLFLPYPIYFHLHVLIQLFELPNLFFIYNYLVYFESVAGVLEVFTNA